MSGLPLSGLRIIAVEQYGAGPFGTQHLADLGAEVIKIENPADGGDVGRHVGPHFVAPGDSQFFQAFNRNKKSIALNIKKPEGYDIFTRLATQADAVFDNLRGDLPAKLGIDYASLAHLNPALVCVHLSAYGRTGSRAAWPGYDYLMQAEAGYLTLTGEPDGPPARAGLSIIDLMTGTTAAMALLAGVLDARSSGTGRDMDVSLFDVALHNLAYLGTWYLNAGAVTRRAPLSSHPSLTPSQLYRTADGWIFIMCNKEKFWRNMAELIGRPAWTDKPEYATFAARLASRDAFNAELEAVLTTKATDEWITIFAGKVPAAPVYDVAQALSSGFVAEQERVIGLDHPDSQNVRSIASPVRPAGAVLPNAAAPAMGSDTDSLLAALGFDHAAIDRLRSEEVVA